MNDAIKEWISISKYDLETADAMFDKGRYLYVAFMCQQAIEKILKAIYAKNRDELPPRTHNLLYLVDELNLVLEDGDKEFLSKLNQFYLESRYPSEQAELAKEVHQHNAKMYIDTTRKIYQCLKEQLP